MKDYDKYLETQKKFFLDMKNYFQSESQKIRENIQIDINEHKCLIRSIQPSDPALSDRRIRSH